VEVAGTPEVAEAADVPSLSSLAPAPVGRGRHGAAGSGHAAVAGTRSVEAEAVGHAAGRKGPNSTADAAAPAALASAAVPATPGAFDALYAAVAPRLTWQTFLLTANRQRATHCVRRAFQLAWTNWPAVSADPSPEGWIRGMSFDLALSPWHGGGPRMQHAFHLPHRRARAAAARVTTDLPLSEQDRALLKALMRLPRPQRRALVLHDVVGLDWAQTAAEVEGTTPVAFGRVARARRALARALPGVVGADPEVAGFGRRLGDRLRATALRADSEAPAPAPAGATRARARLHDGGLTLAAGALTLATAGFLGAGAVWGTPMHPAERRIVPHPTRATVIGTADDGPTRDIQPSKVPAPPLTPFATGPGLIQQNQDTSGDARKSSGSKGAKNPGHAGGPENARGPGDSGSASPRPQHGHPHQLPAKKHH
jgi:DNA-directed RNA polymerase specialized sigma24 family protein